MDKMKKIVSLLLVIALTAAVAVSTTVAFLTDEEEATNQMTMGNVDITLNEKELTDAGFVDFTQDKPIYPTYVEDGKSMEETEKDSWGLYTHEQVVDKIVSVTNTGSNSAFVRVVFAFELGTYEEELFDVIKVNRNETDWVWETVEGVAPIEVDGVTTNFVIVTATYVGNNGILEKGATTPDSLKQVWMAGTATNETCKALDGNGNGKYDILVKAQAMQTEGFDSYLESIGGTTTFSLRTTIPNVFEEVKKAFESVFEKIVLIVEEKIEGESTLNVYHPWMESEEVVVATNNQASAIANLKAGNDVYYIGDLEFATTATGYGCADIVVNGGVYDGNGGTLTVTGNGDYSAVLTSGGTIKNLTINDGFRGLFLADLTKDVVIDNVTIGGEGICYAINTGTMLSEKHSLTVTNSTIKGWTSFAELKSASFINCQFGQGGYYANTVDGRVIKPYVNTTFTNCDLVKGYYLDLSSLGADCKVTITDCTVDGKDITSEICQTSGDYNTATFYVELPSGRTLADCVVFK